MDSGSLGVIFADIKMRLSNLEEANITKKAEQVAKKISNRMNDEIKKGVVRGFSAGVGSIFGGQAGAIVGAMGGGLGGTMGVIIGSVVDSLLRKIGTEISSAVSGTKFLEKIHTPMLEPDVKAIKNVKGYLGGIDATEALRIAEASKVLGTSPEALAKQTAISGKYRGFQDLEGGSDFEKLLNFLVSTSGLDVKTRLTEGAKYGITPAIIPALKTGFGDVGLTKLGKLSGVDFQNYGSLLERIIEEERSAKEKLDQLEILTLKNLSKSKTKSELFGEGGFYKSVYDSPVRKLGRDVEEALGQTTVFQSQKDAMDDASYVAKKAVINELSKVYKDYKEIFKDIIEARGKVIKKYDDDIATENKLRPMEGIRDKFIWIK